MSVWWTWTIAAAVAAGTGDPHGEAALARRFRARGKPLPPRETLLEPPLFPEYLRELYAQLARRANFGDTVERITPSLLAAIESRVADPQARAKLVSKISGQHPPPPGALRFMTTAREVLALGDTDDFQNFRRAAGRPCDAEPAAEDLDHLRPRARVGILLGRNPELMRRMNCPPTPRRPGCSLEGVATL